MTANRPSPDRRDARERVAVWLFRLVNPLVLRMIPAGVPTGAPNVLLLVPGRRSGIERTMPVTLLDFEGRTYVQATYGASGWGRNLRANELLDGHVSLDVECLDRIYVNGYVPNLQVAGQVVSFMRDHLGHSIPPRRSWRGSAPRFATR